MAYLIGLCVSLILTATAVSAKYDIFDFGIPPNATDATDVNTKRDAAEENLCLYVGLNCGNNTDITRPENITKDIVIKNIVDMLASVETYFNNSDPKDYGFKRYSSENGKKVLGLFLDSQKTKELIRRRPESCFSNITETFETIIHNNNITQNFTEFITSFPFDDQHCIAAKKFNNFIQSSSNKIADCDNDTLSIVFDVFEDVRVHLNNCTLPEPVVPDSAAIEGNSSSSSSSSMILGFIHAILLSVILVIN